MSNEERQAIYDVCFKEFILAWKQERPCQPMTQEEIRERVGKIFEEVIKERN